MGRAEKSFLELLDRVVVCAGDTVYLHASLTRSAYLRLDTADILGILTDRRARTVR